MWVGTKSGVRRCGNGALGGAKIGKIGPLERSGRIKLLLSLCTRAPASPSLPFRPCFAAQSSDIFLN